MSRRATPAATEEIMKIKAEKTAWGGWPNCWRLVAGDVELIATTDVGPRIARFGFVGGPNLFKEYREQQGLVGGDEWRIYGGHRLWHAPEAKPRTYAPDNGPVASDWDGTRLKLVQPVEQSTGIEKQIEISLAPDGVGFRVLHRLINRGLWDVELAAWSPTVMAPGGRMIALQEPYRAHSDWLLPARPLVLWHYTDMSDPRWVWGRRYLQLRQDPARATPQKAGWLNRRGWLAYALNGCLFVKRHTAIEGATYPDYGCNAETFTNADMLEVETVGPLTRLTAEGGAVEHEERWSLHRADLGDFSESALDRALAPLGLI